MYPGFSVQAANYLNIKGLLDLTCQTVAQMIKGKTPEEIRKTFNIKVSRMRVAGHGGAAPVPFSLRPWMDGQRAYRGCVCSCLLRCPALQNDFTPEEEEEVRRENQWAFD